MKRYFQVFAVSCVLAFTSSLRAQPADEVAQPPLDPRPSLQQLGEMMDRDWENRPEWAQMAASILKGEEMGPGRGWYKPGESRYDWKWLAETFDADKNETIDASELGTASAFLRGLDRTADETLTAADFEPRSPMSRVDPPTMMASFLFRFLDSDSNGKITPEELSLFFSTVDQDQAGFLTAPDLQSMFRRAGQELAAAPTDLPPEYEPGANPLKDLDMLMSGQFGSLNSGPAINDVAPDFTLAKQDGTGSATLSELRGKPVVLIFGSFT